MTKHDDMYNERVAQGWPPMLAAIAMETGISVEDKIAGKNEHPITQFRVGLRNGDVVPFTDVAGAPGSPWISLEPTPDWSDRMGISLMLEDEVILDVRLSDVVWIVVVAEAIEEETTDDQS